MSSAYGKGILNFLQINDAKYIWICMDNESTKPYKNLNSSIQKFKIQKFIFSLCRNIKIDWIRQNSIQNCALIFTQKEMQNSLIYKYFNRSSFRMISGHLSPKSQFPVKEKFNRKTILWAANMGKNKRPELFLKLAENFKNTDLQFIMVGGHADKDYLSQLLENCPANVLITCHLKFEEALKYFDDASLLVNTSASEGFSNTYVQSWLRGIPTLVFGADPDNVIQENELGFSVNDVAEATLKIIDLFENFETYSALSKNCLDYANENHTIKKMDENFLTILSNEGITLH